MSPASVRPLTRLHDLVVGELVVPPGSGSGIKKIFDESIVGVFDFPSVNFFEFFDFLFPALHRIHPFPSVHIHGLVDRVCIGVIIQHVWCTPSL